MTLSIPVARGWMLPFVGILVTIVLWIIWTSQKHLDFADETGGCCETKTCGSVGNQKTVRIVTLIVAILVSALTLYGLYSRVKNGPPADMRSATNKAVAALSQALGKERRGASLL